MAMNQCCVLGCDRVAVIVSRGWCKTHYMRWYRGAPLEGVVKSRVTEFVDGCRPCTVCSEIKPASAFGRNKKGLSGKQASCRDCQNAIARCRAKSSIVKDQRRKHSRNYSSKRRAMLRNVVCENIDFDKLFESQEGRCAYCACILTRGSVWSPTRATVDHVLPLSRGGDHIWSNVVYACGPCNSQKGGNTPTEWSLRWQ